MFYYSVSYCVQSYDSVPKFDMVDVAISKADDIKSIRHAVAEKIHENCLRVVIINFFPID